jgi:hypothetical protein
MANGDTHEEADEERQTFCAHLEQGYLQAERGQLIDGTRARREIQTMKDEWRSAKRCEQVLSGRSKGLR